MKNHNEELEMMKKQNKITKIEPDIYDQDIFYIQNKN